MTNSMQTQKRSLRPQAAFLAALLQALFTGAAAQAAGTWDGGGADDYWGSATNWVDDVVPAFPEALTFAGSTRLSPTNNLEGATVTNITFAAGAGAFTLWGNPVTLGGNVAIAIASGSVTNDQALNFPVTLSASPTLSAAPAGGSTTVGKGVLIVNGAISGPFGLTSASRNYVQLNGENTYTGDTLISAAAAGDGSFSIGHAGAFGSGKLILGATPSSVQLWVQTVGNKTVTNNVEIRTQRFITASYAVAGKAAGNLTLSGNLFLNQGGGGQDFWCQTPLTLSGTVSGGGLNGFRMASGTVILQGANTFTNHVLSNYALSVPTVNINSDAALGHTNNGVRAYLSNLNLQTAAGTSITAAPSRVFNSYPGKTLTFDIPAASSLTVPGPVTGHALAKSGTGTLALTAVNSHTGGTHLASGILNITTNAALGADSATLNFTGAGTLQPGATPLTLPASRSINLTNASAYTAAIDVPTNFTLTVAGSFSGNAGTNSVLSKTGAGTLVLSGGTSGSPLGGLSVLGGTVSVRGGVWAIAPAQTADGTVFNVLGGATYEQTGGTVTLPIYASLSQQSAGGAFTNLTSVGILSGGTLTGMELMVGRRNSAVMTISGNALLDLYSFKLGELPGFTTVCNLDGGVVACNYIATRATNTTQSTSILNFNGGTLRAKNTSGTPNIIGGFGSGSVSFLNQVNVKKGGAIIDSQSYAVTIPQVLSHDSDLGDSPDGGLTKRGTGTLTLAVTNTFTGLTAIEAGTLKLGAANTLWPGGSLWVASNAVLDVNGKVQTLAGLAGSGLVTNSSLLAVTLGVAPGTTNTVGTLTLASAPASLAGTLLVDVATNGACDRLSVQGSLVVTNLSLAVSNPADLDKNQRYVLASCTGSLTGPFLSAPLPNRWHVAYNAAPGEVLLRYDFGTLLTLQ